MKRLWKLSHWLCFGIGAGFYCFGMLLIEISNMCQDAMLKRSLPPRY